MTDTNNTETKGAAQGEVVARIRHPNGVTLPPAWFEGAQKYERPKPSTDDVPQIDSRADIVRAALTHEWQDLRELSGATGMRETAIRNEILKMMEDGEVVDAWVNAKNSRKRVFALAGATPPA